MPIFIGQVPLLSYLYPIIIMIPLNPIKSHWTPMRSPIKSHSHVYFLTSCYSYIHIYIYIYIYIHNIPLNLIEPSPHHSQLLFPWNKSPAPWGPRTLATTAWSVGRDRDGRRRWRSWRAAAGRATAWSNWRGPWPWRCKRRKVRMDSRWVCLEMVYTPNLTI